MDKEIHSNEFPGTPNYEEESLCPYHQCRTDKGRCWECAVETYGYEEAKRIYEERRK